jgi:hypothetical protein
MTTQLAELDEQGNEYDGGAFSDDDGDRMDDDRTRADSEQIATMLLTKEGKKLFHKVTKNQVESASQIPAHRVASQIYLKDIIKRSYTDKQLEGIFKQIEMF